MRTLYTFLITIFLFLSIHIQPQEIEAKLSGNTSSEGFSVNKNSGTTVFRVRGDGSVGIGTTTPSSQLEIAGNLETNNLLDRDESNFFEGGCGDNQHVTGISADGTISCGPNSGDIAGVIAGSGLSGGGTTGSLTLSLNLMSINTWEGAQTFNSTTNYPGNGIWNTAGNVGIGTTSPGTSNLLELASTTKGFVLPRMVKAQRNAIASPVAGMMIYQTDYIPGLRVYNGTNWMRFNEITDP